MTKSAVSPRRRVRTSAKVGHTTTAPGATMQAARPAQLRATNSMLLLRLLRSNSPCSKADLARMSGLTPPTVSLLAGDLIRCGLAEAMGEGVSSGGRPPAILRFNERYGYAAAADIGGTRLRMMLADLNGTPVAEWDTKLNERQKTPRAIVKAIADGLKHMVMGIRGRKRVLHLTVGAPGITDVNRGVVLAAPNLASWNDVPLRTLLEQELSIPVGVENDTNLAAVGERARGVARDVSDFVFIAMGTGVGAGVFVEGVLHHGSNWSAGEIGYLPVAGQPRQPMLLDQTGQLERMIGGGGIEDEWRNALDRAGVSDEAVRTLRASQIFDLAAAPVSQYREVARAVVNFTARILADAIGILGLLYDPQLVVLGGGVGSHPLLRETTAQFLKQNQLATLDLSTSSLGKQAQLFGAISLSLTAIEAGIRC